jgi:hypothetical protein
MNGFRKIDDPDDDVVVVSLTQVDGLTTATVEEPIHMSDDDVVVPPLGDLPTLDVPSALAAARDLAAQHGVEIVIVDPDDLWLPEWGTLF